MYSCFAVYCAGGAFYSALQSNNLELRHVDFANNYESDNNESRDGYDEVNSENGY